MPDAYSYAAKVKHDPAEGFSDSVFYRIVSQPVEYLTHSAILGLHRELIGDHKSIYQLLGEETARDTFLLCFQEQSARIIHFFRKIKTAVSLQAHSSNSLIVALLQGVVIPLFEDAYQDLFLHGEMMELTILALQNYLLCSNPTGPVSKLLERLTQFPEFLEKLISHQVGGIVIQNLIQEPWYGQTVFEGDVVRRWVERLAKLGGDCTFSHEISDEVEKWDAIMALKAAFPPPAPTYFETQRKGFGQGRKARTLSKDDKKSGAGTSSAPTSSLLVSPEAARLLRLMALEMPKTPSAAYNAVAQLELKTAFDLLKTIIGSFPCSACSSRIQNISKKGTYKKVPPGASNSLRWGESSHIDKGDLGAMNPNKEQELKDFGLWRIVLSRQAMKDLSEARKAGNFKAIENKLRELATGNWEKRRALTKKHKYSALPVPIKKAVYDDNGRIIWYVHVTFDEIVGRASQVLLGKWQLQRKSRMK